MVFSFLFFVFFLLVMQAMSAIRFKLTKEKGDSKNELKSYIYVTL